MPAELTLPEPPAGIVMLDLADIGAVHNAIADALGEPRMGPSASTSDPKTNAPSPKPTVTDPAARRFTKSDRRM
jgi:hypothetical protein